jgi:tRNA nucleotidyltransferase/poly(A) polymerase
MVADFHARPSKRPLVWSDALLDLFDQLAMLDMPLYVVGGAVRDALLRRPVKDLDLTTPEHALKLARKIADVLGGDYYPLDSERQIGRVLLEGDEGRLVIDVARFRGDDLIADLQDRDFTVNALAWDVRGDPGSIIDPTGGEQDLIDKVLRHCSAGALAEDPIRTLRAVRQSVQFGFRIEPATLADVRAQLPRLHETSPERVRDEFFRLLALPKAASALKILEVVGGLAVVLPELHDVRLCGVWDSLLLRAETLLDVMATISPRRTDETAARFSLGMFAMALDRYRPQLQTHLDTEWADERTQQALLLFALLAAASSDEQSVLARYPLSNREQDRLALIIRQRQAYRALAEDRSPLALHRYWRALGEAGIDVCLLSLVELLAESGIQIDQDVWIHRLEHARATLEAWYDQYERIVEPPVLLDGNALMAETGLKPGRIIGEVLTAIREGQVVGTVTTQEEALALARSIIAGR